VVIEDERELDGRKAAFTEVFLDISDNGFTQTIYEGESRKQLKPTVIIVGSRVGRAKQ
jgi:hypothetical protein